VYSWHILSLCGFPRFLTSGAYSRKAALQGSFMVFKEVMTQGMQDKIQEKLARGLQPTFLEIVNDSARHAGHSGDDGSGESHFKVTVVSLIFAGKSRVERQRMVYALLSEEFGGGLHALSIKALTPDEYRSV
jgi:BolA protein